jgi:magnesium transporter
MPGGRLTALRPRRRIIPLRSGEAAPELNLDPRRSNPQTAHTEESPIDATIYREGRPIGKPLTIDEAARLVRENEGAVAWISIYQPAESQLWDAAEDFGLHELAIEDAVVAHQRPKLERYGDTRFIVLRAARYIDQTEEVEFGEIHVFVGLNFVIVIRHRRAPDLDVARQHIEADPELLARGPAAILYSIMDCVVDGYAPVVAGLQNDIDEIESQVFAGHPNVSRRIYKLSRAVVEFEHAVRPLDEIFARLDHGFDGGESDTDIGQYMRDTADHATIVAERVTTFRQMLRDILTVNATLVSQAQNAKMQHMAEVGNAQNEEVKRISAWAAILFAPTVIGTIYGMNFDHMPELRWLLGYPYALALMAVTCITLWTIFRRRNWL